MTVFTLQMPNERWKSAKTNLSAKNDKERQKKQKIERKEEESKIIMYTKLCIYYARIGRDGIFLCELDM